MKTLIKNGLVITPESTFLGYVLYEDGVIVEIGEGDCASETDETFDAEGRYIVPLDREGVYTITYTVDALKFGESAPNGVVKRVRVFTVSAAEEDGRNGEA